jgi:deazaflavin-dependent oxidoreductase (nitroreductase family)
VIASNAGNRNTPGWALNLEASPDAEVQVGGTRSRVQARRVDGNERTTLWHKMNRLYAGFDDYGVRTARQIRVFVLEPSDADQELSY